MPRPHRLPLSFLSFLSCLALLATSPASPAAEPDHASATAPASVRAKKLIEFGWDEPDTAFMRKHIAEMEKTPFDGCVFHARYTKADGSPGDFLWECWGKRAFAESELKAAIDDLKATEFHRFTENFLRFNTVPGELDWFDDFAAVVNNARLAAAVARAGGCRGVLFDIEQYNHPLFNYRKQRDAGSKSWDEYAAQARRRGREVMTAFREGYPGLTVFLTFGYSLPMAECRGDKSKLPDCSYGLLAPFLDGMVDAAEGDEGGTGRRAEPDAKQGVKGGARLVDGCELSYGYKDTSRFPKEYAEMKTGALKILGADPERYRRVFSFGFGVWMDQDWRKHGWDVSDLSKNFYSPEAFEHSVRTALETADDYVWIYTEQPRWWTAEGGPRKLPPAYEHALRRALAIKAE